MARISTSWLNDYVDISDEDLKELANRITNAGVNVEEVIKNDIPNLVVGQILELEPHPDSDHMSVCKIDVGSEVLQVVCGASNLYKNMKVIVAKEGCVLPNGMKIVRAMKRGVESQGMCCALMELGLEEETEENYAKGIADLRPDALVGTNPFIYLGLDDTVYSLDLNPNREADCTNHIGFAYETAAVLSSRVLLPDTKVQTIKGRNIKDELELDVITDYCTMYNARKVVNVEIKESPDFIKERLTSCGMRPINNVVDISNYIMLEYGQPLHFFDADKLGKSILVRMAEKGEKITTLDKQVRKLTPDDIVITDGEMPVCIAGVMGGINSGIDENTKNVVIESAIFDPLKIRYTSIRLDLKSEASRRYEHGLNYEYTTEALNRACYLLQKYAEGEVLEGTLTHDIVDKTVKTAKVTLLNINALLGVTMSIDDAKRSLNALQFPYELKGEEFTVTIPNRRRDVSIKEDLIEEIGRLYGYNHIESHMPILSDRAGCYAPFIKYRKTVSKRLRTLGLNEARTYTLVSPEVDSEFSYNRKETIKLLKPMSAEKSILRQSLVPSLMQVANYNFARNMSDVCIYEIANTYYDKEKEETKVAMLLSGNYIYNTWKNEMIKCDFYVLKGLIVNLLDYLGFQGRYTFISDNSISDMHPGATAILKIDGDEIGYLGRVHPKKTRKEVYVAELSLNKMFDKKTRGYKYKEISKYPSITKDVAFVMPECLEADAVLKEIKKCSSKLLKDIKIFDLYTGENVLDDEKSIAYSLIYEDEFRTLSSEEVNAEFNKAIDEVTKKLKISIRN